MVAVLMIIIMQRVETNFILQREHGLLRVKMLEIQTLLRSSRALLMSNVNSTCNLTHFGIVAMYIHLKDKSK